MAATAGGWSETRRGALWLLHSPEVDPDLLLIAIERHRENVARGRDYCEQVGPGSSVSRVHAAFTGHASGLDLAVKWNHWRGWRGAAYWFFGGPGRGFSFERVLVLPPLLWVRG
ncbi:MAG: hypothetical protein IIA30_02235 [Myxococcales bacterium]|nr:hypothetical protein [Myxococcales bacterium]